MTSTPDEALPPQSRYVEIVKERYENWLPERLAEIPEDERGSFYSTLAQEIDERVQSLELDLRGPGPVGEGFMERVGRFNMAHVQAEEMALAEVLPEPEPEAEVPDTPVIDDLEIRVRHNLDLEDEDYQVQMESWREHYRQKRLGP